MFRKTIASVFILLLVIPQVLFAEGFMIESKEDALNKLKSRLVTYNESYPGGTTTAPSVTYTCPPTPTCPPAESCPTCPACITPAPQGVDLVYILTPVFALLGLGVGIGVGAVCMRKYGNRRENVAAIESAH